MAIATPKPPIQVALSNANFVDPFVAYKFGMRTPEAVGEFAQQVEADGVEWIPFGRFVYGESCSVRKVAAAVLSGALVLTSLHDSFADKHPWRAPEPDRSALAMMLASPIGRYIVVPMQQSPRWQTDLQHRLADPDNFLDEVHYPVPVQSYGAQAALKHTRQLMAGQGGQRKMYQPTDFLARAVGAESPAQLADQLRYQGYHPDYPFVLDTFHGRRTHSGVPPVVSQNLLDGVAPMTGEIHLSLGRSDMPGFDSALMDHETSVALQGQGEFDGHLREILDAALEQGDPSRIVIEAPMQMLALYCRMQTLRDMIKAYAAIINSVRTLAATHGRHRPV